ncbi:AAA domain protein [uncultured archaeon]|nr:AAA domain protein [uncultured archaeon]
MADEEVFEEWTSYAKRKELLPRDIDLDSIIKNSSSKIIAITGVRRSGKSSILMMLAQKLADAGKKACYVNVEDSRIKDRPAVLDDAIKWFGDDGFMLLDEVTSARDWDGWLSRTHELLKGKLHVIVSSSRRSITFPSKPLRGRILAYEVFPLSFVEFLRFKGVGKEKTTAGRGKVERALEEYLKYGGFPEVVLTEDFTDKVRILDSYFKDIIGLDVAEISKQDLSTVEVFGKYVIQANYFSASKCLNFLKTLGYKIGKEKILELEKYSEASYLFFFMTIFSHNIKDRSQYPRKAYLGDTGFYYGTSGKVNFGSGYENIVFLELKRRLREQQKLYYWKNQAGLECDFVIKEGIGTAVAIQVVYDMDEEKTEARERSGLLQCSNELAPSSTMIITRNIEKTEETDGIKIKYIPIIDWLLDIRN